MDLNSQNKVLKADFMLIRKDDQPQPRIKYKQLTSSSFSALGIRLQAGVCPRLSKTFGFPEWRTFEKFDTKAARDRRYKELLHDSTIIED